jgi:hypothetical protein
MDRTYLFVPPEEKAEVQSLGAEWDTVSKRWYIGPKETPAKFARWLPPFEGDEDEEGEELDIISSQAFVAATTVPCSRCHANIEVICIHCTTGTVADEPLTEFTVSDIWAMDEDLSRQLASWPTFHKTHHSEGEDGNFANHCPHCGEIQDDLYLHSEPDHPFFDIPHAPAGVIKLTPLSGTIHLGGGEHFSME